MTETRTTKQRYRWSHPREWLDHHITTLDGDQLENVVRWMADLLDGDQLQDLFQSEMDDDGYFHDLNLCPHCESPLTTRTVSSGHPSYCEVCDREVALP